MGTEKHNVAPNAIALMNDHCEFIGRQFDFDDPPPAAPPEPTVAEKVQTRLAEIDASVDDKVEEGTKALRSESEELRTRLEKAEEKIRLIRGPDGVEGKPKPISFARLFRGIILNRLGVKDAWDGSEYERDAAIESKNIRATMLSSQDSHAGYFIAPQYMPQHFIDKLWSEVVLSRLGVTHIPGLAGSPVMMSKKTGSTTAYYVGEVTAPTESNPTLGMASMSPKILKGLSKLSKLSLMLASPEYEKFVQDDLAQVIARRRELGVLEGIGGNNQPLGLINHDDIGSSSIGGVPADLDDFLEMVYTVESQDAANGKLGFLMNPREWHTLRLKKDSTGRYLLPRAADGSVPKMLHGYPVVTSTAVPINLNGAKGRVIFGNWADLVDGEWDGITFDATDKSNDWWETGIVGILVTLFHDVLVRHPESFVVDNTVEAT